METYNVEYYELWNGKCPVQDFIDTLSPTMQAKTYRDIEILRELGNQAGLITKAIGDGIFELRTHVGSNHSRILYFFRHGNSIVLAVGFIKKTEKTPKKFIELAKKLTYYYTCVNLEVICCE